MSIEATVERNPALILGAVGVVALLAYLSSRNSSQAGTVEFTGGGSSPGTIDPTVAQIEESKDSTFASTFGVLSSYLLGSQQSSDALEAYDISANRDIATANIGASRDVSIAGINANRDTSVAETNANAAITGAKITADTQNRITAANISLATINKDVEDFRTQANKDIERAKANAGIVGDVVKGAVHILTFGLF